MSQVESGEKKIAVTFPANVAPTLCNVFGASRVSESIVIDFGFVNPNALKILQKATDDSLDLVEAVQVSKITIEASELDRLITALEQIQKEMKS
ncbi:MAG: hypothetical protein RLZZ156_2375 [Deinococcota bacterium]|jgi:hypothetical protein